MAVKAQNFLGQASRPLGVGEGTEDELAAQTLNLLERGLQLPPVHNRLP
jgi:hypothetical protein